MNRNESGRVYELDSMRFLAAMSVLFYHYTFRGYAADGYSQLAFPEFSRISVYGFLGVEFFFLISGFVILMSAQKGGVFRFVASRAVRLYPAFWVCCTFTYVMVHFFGSPVFTSSFEQYLINLTMLSGFIDVPSIDGVYWSLFVEIRFYALIALLIWVGLLDRFEWVAFAWVFSCYVLFFYPSRIIDYVLITKYAPFFIGGAMCYRIWQEGGSILRYGILTACWILGVTGSVKGTEEFANKYNFALNPLVISILVSLFYLAIWLVAIRRTGRFSRINFAVLGGITYPLYLLHQNFGYIIFNRFGGVVDSWTLLLVTSATVALLSFLVFRYVEPRLSAMLRNLINLLYAYRLGM